jgi:DNA polymerase elongation subunit (family B)
VDAIFDRKTDTIHIAERINGQRHLKQLPVQHVFYCEHPTGQHRSIFGHTCRKYTFASSQKFRRALMDARDEKRRIFESDINPVFRCLADNYMGADVPVLNIGFFDIEADFDAERGFAAPEDPFNKVTAITLYRTADKKLLTWALCPQSMPLEAAQKLAEGLSDTFVYDDERKLLEGFLEAIEDVDCISGWNSSSFDVPYLVNRIKRIISNEATRKFCLWDQLPTTREYMNKFGRKVTTYDFVGRVHLDYIDLYIKHNTQQRLSYALNAIGEIEVGETKTPYEGTLDDLYKKDFRNFIEYNRQDVMLMVKIDEKNKFIELANQIAHANCVLLKTTMGSVALVEQAIINEMHAMGRIVPDRKPREEDDRVAKIDPENEIDEMAERLIAAADNDDEEDEKQPVVGAYVAQPKKGLHEHIGAVDINSLYPSAIRALNMSPETLVGQVRPTATDQLIAERAAKLTATQRAEAWDGLFSIVEVQWMHDRTDDVMVVDFFDNLTGEMTTREMTGAQLHDYVFDNRNGVCITANGTLFKTREFAGPHDKEGKDTPGMIPLLLQRWYADRKAMQAKAKEYGEMAAGVEIDAELATLLQEASA